jgi:hypothetical protein
MKPFSETKVGAFLKDKAPDILGVVGDVLPDKGGLGVIKNMIKKHAGMSEEEKDQAIALVVEHEVELTRLENEDRANARKRESDIVTSENAPILNKIVQPILALVIVGSTIIIWALILFRNYEPKVNEAMIIGALTTMSANVLQYYFGSSSGSKQKSDQLDQMRNK